MFVVHNVNQCFDWTKLSFYRFRHCVWPNADVATSKRNRRAPAKVHNFQPTAALQTCASQSDLKVKLFPPMRRRESACPAGREQFSLPVVWGSPARWRVQGRRDGTSRRRCSPSRRAGGRRWLQTRRSPTGSRRPTSSRTWGRDCKCKWRNQKKSFHMKSK